MSILMISNNSAYGSKSFGGAESSMRLLAETLVKRDYEVIYVTKQDDKLSPGVKKEIVNQVKLLNYCKLSGSRFLPILNRINEHYWIYILKSIIQERMVKVVYCFYEPNILHSLFKLRKSIKSFKIIMRMAGMYWYEVCKKNPSLIPEYEYIFNQLDSVNYIHSGLKRMVNGRLNDLGMKVNFKHTFIGDIGTSVSFDRSSPYQPINDGIFKLIMATRFSIYQKRQDVLVEAIAKIPQTIPIKLYMVGSGPQQPVIVDLADKLEILDRIKFVPFLNQEELWGLMQQVDMLCHACEYEGLGKIIIESMTLGLPVLASNVTPLNDYIKDGKNGFLVDNNSDLWAERIEDIYYNSKQLKTVSDLSIQFIKENYNPDNNVYIYEDAFKEVLANC